MSRIFPVLDASEVEGNLPCPIFAQGLEPSDTVTEEATVGALRSRFTDKALAIPEPVVETFPFSLAIQTAITEAVNRILRFKGTAATFHGLRALLSIPEPNHE